MGPGTTVGAVIHKTIYAPMIYFALYVIFLMRANQLLAQAGGGWALEISTFLVSKWHSPNGLMPFHRAQKGLDRAQPPPNCLRNGSARIINIT